MPRVSVLAAVATLSIASVFLLAKSNEQAAGVARQGSIDVLAIHMNADLRGLPVSFVANFI